MARTLNGGQKLLDQRACCVSGAANEKNGLLV